MTLNLNENDRVVVLPDADEPAALHGHGTVVTVCPFPDTGLPARSVVVVLDDGEVVGVNLDRVEVAS